MTTLTKEISPYQSTLDQLLDNSILHPMAVLKKQAALEQFLQLGIPTMKHEDWKYTYLQKILNKGFKPGFIPAVNSADIQSVLPSINHPSGIRLVIVDGQFNSTLSSIQNIEGLHISSIATELSLPESDVVENLGKLADTKRHALTALNLALFQDGVSITVESRVQAAIDLIYIVTDSNTYIRQPYLQITLKENAQLHIHEHQHLLGKEGMQNMVSEVFLNSASSLEWVKIQDPGEGAYFIDSTYVHQAEKSNYHTSAVTLTGELLRNQQYVVLNGEEAHADLSGLYLLNREEQADNLIYIRHKVPNCTSNQLFKGIMDGKSTGVFNGKIVVDQDAQQTNAYQSNKNILVSDEAAAYFRPQLEIFANDVKCSHGATSAEIEDSELFYLRARGIGKEKAKSLLMLAFAADVVAHISDVHIREEAIKKIENKLQLN
jgi:Fe-S cluster assembly protein SufD